MGSLTLEGLDHHDMAVKAYVAEAAMLDCLNGARTAYEAGS